MENKTNDHSDPPGTDFLDAATSRAMRLVTEGPYAGWLLYRHQQGHWVTLRKASPGDLAALSRGEFDAGFAEAYA